MSKEKTEYFCTECGTTTSKWLGKCPSCNAWNSIEERSSETAEASAHRYAPLAPSMGVTPLSDIAATEVERFKTGNSEFDLVLGGGIVRGSVILLGGEPGVGKSTLLLQTLDAFQRSGLKTHYVSGEESGAQVAMRARRLGLGKSAVPFQAEIQLEKILRTLEDERPVLCVIDSIQTIWSDKLTAAPGGVSQVKECGAQLARCAKALGIAVVLVGHVTKEGDLAGPRVLEHQVDCSLMFQGDPNSNYRLIRALKNRFGAVNELAVLHMSETGLKPVSNPSAIFLSNHDAPVPGSCVMATIDGTRPMLVEIQSLVDSGGPSPRRLTIGLERDRLSMLLAVLNRHGGIHTSDQDVFVNAVGGMKISEPAADLSVILAIHSSIRGKPLPRGVLCFGEVGLAGEVRPAPKGFERLNEAAKLGFTHIILPKANVPKKAISGINLYPVSRIEEALSVVMNNI